VLQALTINIVRAFAHQVIEACSQLLSFIEKDDANNNDTLEAL
jgi:hypothetical protein